MEKRFWKINKKLIKNFKNILATFLTYVVLIISYMLVLFNEHFNLSGFMSKAFTLAILMFVTVITFFFY